MKIGVTIYSFNRLIREGKADKDRAVELAAKVGVTGVEMLDIYWPGGRLSVPTPTEVRDFAALVEENGLEMCCYTLHNNFGAEDPAELRKEIDHVKRHIDVGAAMGLKVMRIESCYGPAGATMKTVDPRPFEDRVVKATKEVAEVAGKAGIRLGLENHGRLIATSKQMLSLFERVNSPWYGATIDIGNFAVVDEDSLAATRALAKHAFHAHAKDFIIREANENPGEGWGKCVSGRWYQGIAIGEGVIPVKECLETLVKSGYKGYLSVEYEGKDADVVEGVRRSVANLKGMLAAMGG